MSCGRDTPTPPSTSTFPSGPVRTAIFPPEPSSTLTLPRNLYVVTDEDAALSLEPARLCKGLAGGEPAAGGRKSCTRHAAKTKVASREQIIPPRVHGTLLCWCKRR